MKIAFIGTGVMGAPMAGHLLEAGHEVSVYNRTREKAEPLTKKGAILKDTVSEAVEDADMVISIVGYPKDVESIYLGENGIIKNAKKGAVLIDMTTTDPSLSKRIYGAAKEEGLKALDAPVSGGDIGAQNATLSIMVGGDKETFDLALPIFKTLGTNIKYMGEAGSGQHTKLSNQIAIAGALSGVCEALAYAEKAGLDPLEVIEAIQGGAAGSWQLSNLGPKMVTGDFDPGFFIKHMIKDLKLADKEAETLGVELPVEEMTLGHFEEVDQDELGTQALYQYYKK